MELILACLEFQLKSAKLEEEPIDTICFLHNLLAVCPNARTLCSDTWVTSKLLNFILDCLDKGHYQKAEDLVEIFGVSGMHLHHQSFFVENESTFREILKKLVRKKTQQTSINSICTIMCGLWGAERPPVNTANFFLDEDIDWLIANIQKCNGYVIGYLRCLRVLCMDSSRTREIVQKGIVRMLLDLFLDSHSDFVDCSNLAWEALQIFKESSSYASWSPKEVTDFVALKVNRC